MNQIVNILAAKMITIRAQVSLVLVHIGRYWINVAQIREEIRDTVNETEVKLDDQKFLSGFTVTAAHL